MTRAASSTSLIVSPASVAYGSETMVQFTATISPQFAGTPTGTATITSGGITLCTMALSGGAGTCSLASGTVLPVGTRTMTAHYGGDDNFRPSAASTQLKITAG